MKIREVAQMIFGMVSLLLGTFWFLQGVGILNVCPILCFADCACVEGGSRFWGAAGAAAFIIGILAIMITMRHR